MIIATEYPFGPVRWLGPPVKRREGGEDVTYVLAASGPEFELNLLRITQDGESVEPLGEENRAVLDRAQHDSLLLRVPPIPHPG